MNLIIASLIVVGIILLLDCLPKKECVHQIDKSGRHGFCPLCKSHFKLERCDNGPMFWTYSTKPSKSDVWYI